MGIFIGVNYGEGRGGNIAGHNGLDERGGGESCMQIFSTRGGVVGPPEGEGESGRHIVSTHGEEKIWRRTGFLQVWGTVHNKSSCMPG